MSKAETAKPGDQTTENNLFSPKPFHQSASAQEIKAWVLEMGQMKQQKALRFRVW